MPCSPFPGIVSVSARGEARLWLCKHMDVVGFAAGSPGYASIAHYLSRPAPSLSLLAAWSVAVKDPAGSASATAPTVTSCDSLPDGTLLCGYTDGSIARWSVPFPARFDTAVRSLFMADVPTAHTFRGPALASSTACHGAAVNRVSVACPPLSGLDLLAVVPPAFQVRRVSSSFAVLALV